MRKLIKAVALAAAAALCLLVFTASSSSAAAKAPADPAKLDKTKSFVIALYPEYAPITCENFEKLVSSGFYDGLTFHRVYKGFMAQGGDPTGTGSGGSDKIKGEFAANGERAYTQARHCIDGKARKQL